MTRFALRKLVAFNCTVIEVSIPKSLSLKKKMAILNLASSWYISGYASWYKDLLNNVTSHFSYEVSHVKDDPQTLTDKQLDADCLLLTGSRSSVNFEESWMASLSNFMEKWFQLNRPTIGVCFGAQYLAKHFGGMVRQYDWEVGNCRLTVKEEAPWMLPPANTLNILTCHQDYVVRLPEGGKVFASTNKSSNSIFTIGSKILGIQSHPEMPLYHMKSMVNGSSIFSTAEAKQAVIDSLSRKNDANILASWMTCFIYFNDGRVNGQMKSLPD